MKNFKSYLNASVAEDKNPFHIIVITKASENVDSEENKWTKTGVTDYWQFTEKPENDSENVYIHLARQKHVNTKSNRVAWHVNGFKHDKQAFNNNLNGVESARNIVKAVLKLPENNNPESIPNENAAALLSGIHYLPNKAKIFVFKVSNKQ